ncbi:glycoside hydrolase family 13 protein [Lentinula edodes]|uniref:Glycoside hydrolase family 13 protein n=1 Tax=Lentinula edodes TaxID=5353 RepID=A0A1Q3EBP8_LENED|nr:glycoside hydrolase family 13 protein [Lentinula edodes]
MTSVIRCANICGKVHGPWIVFMTVSQADDLPNRKNVAQWFKDRFDRIKATALLFLRPKYFALVISEAYKLLVALSSNNALHQTDCFACFRSVCVK